MYLLLSPVYKRPRNFLQWNEYSTVKNSTAGQNCHLVWSFPLQIQTDSQQPKIPSVPTLEFEIRVEFRNFVVWGSVELIFGLKFQKGEKIKIDPPMRFVLMSRPLFVIL
jgi:hypothetical protein